MPPLKKITNILAVLPILFSIWPVQYLHLSSASSTSVSGFITSDTLWTVGNSPYIVTSTVQVAEFAKLTIEPGVTVRFAQDASLNIEGSLIARGTQTQPITFTSNALQPNRGDWGQIVFYDYAKKTYYDSNNEYLSGSIIENCVIEFGGGHALSTGAAILIAGCNIHDNKGGIYERPNVSGGRITHNLVSNNRPQGGIYATNVLIKDNIVTNNLNEGGSGGGIYADNSSIIVGNKVLGNESTRGGGIYANGATMIENTVLLNKATLEGGGVNIWGDVLSNTIRDNTSGWEAGGLYLHRGRAENNLISKNKAAGSGGGIYANDSLMSVLSNNIVIDNTAQRGGGIFTSCDVQNNVIADNQAHQGGGIYIGNNPTIISNTISNNLVDIGGQGSGIFVYSTYDTVLANNSIVGNRVASSQSLSTPIGGIAISDQFYLVQGNNLYGNGSYDLVNLWSREITFTDAYWNVQLNNEISTRIYDNEDDNNLGRVVYFPYLNQLSLSAPLPPPLNLTATFEGNTAYLSWEPLPGESTRYRYKIYYDMDESLPPYLGTGLSIGASSVDVGLRTSIVISDFIPQKQYYFAITAYDSQSRESWYSNVVANFVSKAYLPFISR